MAQNMIGCIGRLDITVSYTGPISLPVRPLQINLQFLVLRLCLFFHDFMMDYTVTSIEKMTVA